MILSVQIGPDTVIGTWSIDARFGPGAMEDCLLYFGQDRIGCIWFGNLAGAQAATFVWQVIGGRLTTVTRQQFQSADGEQGPLRPGGDLDFDLFDVPVTVEVESTPSGDVMRVLKLPPESLSGIGGEFGFLFPEPHPVMRPLLA